MPNDRMAFSSFEAYGLCATEFARKLQAVHRASQIVPWLILKYTAQRIRLLAMLRWSFHNIQTRMGHSDGEVTACPEFGLVQA
jgi:L-asparagine transporter-like permease